MKKPVLHGATSAALDRCSPTQLKALLRLALDDDERSEPRAPAARSEDVARSLDDLCRALGHPTGLVATILSEGVTVEQLRGLKNLAKSLVRDARSGAEREAAKLAYYLAVARAFGGFGARISRVSFDTRRELFDEYAREFSGRPIGRVFDQAARANGS